MPRVRMAAAMTLFTACTWFAAIAAGAERIPRVCDADPDPLPYGDGGQCQHLLPRSRSGRRPASCCCTASRPRRTCSAISSRCSPIAITSSRPTIPASVRATCPIAEVRVQFDASPISSTSCSTRSASQHYAIYVMDYGAPVGYRLAIKHPERVTRSDRQNGNAYEEGLKEFWDPIKAYWANGSTGAPQGAPSSSTPATTVPVPRRRRGRRASIRTPGCSTRRSSIARQREIQMDLFYDYRTNVPLYPAVPGILPRTPAADADRLGQERHDLPAEGATPYLRDLPNAELHLLDTGHFALEDRLDDMAPLIRDFLDRKHRNALIQAGVGSVFDINPCGRALLRPCVHTGSPSAAKGREVRGLPVPALAQRAATNTSADTLVRGRDRLHRGAR